MASAAVTPQIDLSAGLIPKSAPVSASAGGIDLSAGLVPKPSPPSFGSNVAAGLGEAGKDIWGTVKNMVPGGPAETAALHTVWNNLPPVQLAQQTEQILPVIDAYEKARSGGASITDAIKASDVVARQHARNIDVVGNAVKAFQANPTREGARAVTDAAAAIAASFGGDAALGAIAPEAESAETAMATKTATPAPSWATRINPFRKFTGSDIQPTLKTGIRDVWNQTADDAGVPRPTLTTAPSIRDAGQQVGDAILARSKANYKLIDDATGGRFSGTEQALKSVNQDLRSVTSDTQEQELMTRKTRLEMQMNQMMDEAETKGVPKSAVDAAKADFKKAQAVYDTNHQIRMSTTGVRPDMPGATDAPEEVNPKTLLNRTNKLYDSGRMQQAIGDDGSADLIGHSAKAIKMAKNVARNQKIAGAAAGLGGLGGIEAVRHLIP